MLCPPTSCLHLVLQPTETALSLRTVSLKLILVWSFVVEFLNFFALSHSVALQTYGLLPEQEIQMCGKFRHPAFQSLSYWYSMSRQFVEQLLSRTTLMAPLWHPCCRSVKPIQALVSVLNWTCLAERLTCCSQMSTGDGRTQSNGT